MLSIYKASAGSGKTYTLTHKYIDLLLAQSNIQQAHRHILAVTFTKKATAEMKERILRELSKAPQDSPERKALIAILQDYTHFAVSTIDGFFQLVVRQFARELGLPALFNLTLDTEEVVNQAVDDLTFHGDNEWLHDYIEDNIHSGKGWNPKEDIQKFAKDLLTEQVRELLPLIQSQLDDLEFMRAYKAQLQAQALEEAAKPKKEQDLTAAVILKHLNELGTLSAIAKQIEQTNKEQNRLPISDINHLLARVVQSVDSAFVYEKLGSRYHHFMIDEFQDTSKLQWENFKPLIEESNAYGHTNMVVGDVKQSIYRWRNSDWRLLDHEVENSIPQHDLPPMKTNYRSSEVVVKANNEIFERYVDWAANKLNADLKELSDTTRSELLRSCYSTLRQEPHSKEQGYVHIEFLKAEKRTQANEEALERVPAIIDDLIARHVPYQQIAILVRGNKEAQEIAQYLIEKGYPIQTAEGLLLSSHPTIEIIICLLSLTLTPNDQVLQARLQIALQKISQAQPASPDATGAQIDLRRNSGAPADGTVGLGATREAAVSEEVLSERTEKSVVLPLYDLVQHIIDQYRLADIPGAIPYLTAFQDLVYSFIASSPAHVAAFLDYWHRCETKATIPASSSNAISIMTIHKAKGLEWQAVIIPYCSWPYAKSKPDTEKLLWIDTRTLSTIHHPPSTIHHPQSTGLALLPIQFSKDLLKTAFQEQYADELLSLYLDNLNLTYVAFTRAKNELYVFGQDVHALTRKPQFPTIDHLLSELYPNGLIIGEQKPYNKQEDTATDSDSLTTYEAVYHSVPLGSRLTLRTRVLRDDATALDIRDLGIAMHDWLAGIVIPADRETALNKLIARGQVRETDIPELQQRMNQFMTFVEEGKYDWFKPHEQVLCEQDILLKSGHTERPDRVMIDGKKAVIIDYKFGSEHKQTYQEQVRDYVSYFEAMGYTTEGYIVYVTLQKVDKV